MYVTKIDWEIACPKNDCGRDKNVKMDFGHILKGRTKKIIKRKNIGMDHIEDKIRKLKLRWFIHVRKRLENALITACERPL